MATIVTGDQYEKIDGQLFEIKRQLRQKGGYPYNPEDLKRTLQRVIEGGLVKTFPVFKTIKIGSAKTANNLKTALESADCRVGYRTDKMIDRIVFSILETEVDLVKISAADLGFKRRVGFTALYWRARELGLQPCPSEAGAELRRQYLNQPKEEKLFVAMVPMCLSTSMPSFVFSLLSEDDGLWLDHCNEDGEQDNGWDISCYFVFCQPRD